MTEQEQTIQQLQAEIKRLQRLVFQATPMKRGGLSLLFSKEKGHGFGGASDYEVWLRTLEHTDLNRLVELQTGVIDAFRYRRRFIQNELEPLTGSTVLVKGASTQIQMAHQWRPACLVWFR